MLLTITFTPPDPIYSQADYRKRRIRMALLRGKETPAVQQTVIISSNHDTDFDMEGALLLGRKNSEIKLVMCDRLMGPGEI